MHLKVDVPFISAFALTLTLCGCSEASPPPVEYQPTPHLLAQGNAEAGREAFIALECNSCHTVAGDEFGFDAVGEKGPRLGSTQSALSAEALASAIVMPSHTISRKWKDRADSEMTDYSTIMTVRELIDIVAYLRGDERGDPSEDDAKTPPK